jgi:hypothetical protein
LISRNCRVDCLTFFYYIGEEFNYEWPSCVAGSNVRDGRSQCAIAHDIKPETSKAETGGFKRSQSGERGRILHIPTPDYSVILPKVHCWGSSLVTSIKEEVSVAISCHVVAI